MSLRLRFWSDCYGFLGSHWFESPSYVHAAVTVSSQARCQCASRSARGDTATRNTAIFICLPLKADYLGAPLARTVAAGPPRPGWIPHLRIRIPDLRSLMSRRATRRGEAGRGGPCNPAASGDAQLSLRASARRAELRSRGPMTFHASRRSIGGSGFKGAQSETEHEKLA